MSENVPMPATVKRELTRNLRFRVSKEMSETITLVSMIDRTNRPLEWAEELTAVVCADLIAKQLLAEEIALKASVEGSVDEFLNDLRQLVMDRAKEIKDDLFR